MVIAGTANIFTVTSREPRLLLPDGQTIAQREKTVEFILELMWTDPENLLPEDRTLLDEDFDRLGAADVSGQAY